MGSFVTSALVAALSVASLVSAAPSAKTGKKVSASQVQASALAEGTNLARDLATLQAFAQTIQSDPQNIKANWSAAGNNVCLWAGVTCEEISPGNNAVTGIDFNGYEFGPNLRLQGLLDKLTDVSFFHVNSNNFVGTVPDISQLPNLWELDLSSNQISGGFPPQLVNKVLTWLDLRFNQLQGPLPPDLFTSTDMDAIFLNDNQFSGPLPEAGGISTLYITLANNQFTGPIPESFANIKGLKEILFLGNHFTGSVPEALCALDLDVLDVSNNPGLNEKLGPKCSALFAKQLMTITDTALSVST